MTDNKKRKAKKYHNIRTLPKSNRKNRGKNDTHIHDR